MVRTLSAGPDDLTRYFDAATIARGMQYAREGRIADVYWGRDGRTVSAGCYGSRDHVYGVDGCFKSLGPRPVIEWTSCTCPVETNCKRAVALVLTAAVAVQGPADRWRTAFADVLNEMPGPVAHTVDRSHRIGQTRSVTAYRLVSRDTIEEKVVALQQRKRELFAAVVDEGELFSSALTASDVRELVG